MAYTFQEFKVSEVAEKPHYLVIGHPISHSLSPLMHQTALDYHGIDANYLAVDISADQVSEFIAWCNRETFRGCNITIPYKETFKHVVDEIDEAALQVGVINTIVKNNYSLKGFNTDVFGFLMGIKPLLADADRSRAIIFGTGGASLAVKAALAEAGFEELIFVSRNASNKTAWNEQAGINVVDYTQWKAFADDASLIVNSTPVGMYPDTDQMFISDNEGHLLRDKICYDLIYNPFETRFLKEASNNGGIAVGGLDMLIYQGSRSFELWTGHTFPVEIIRKKLAEYFTEK